MTMSIRTNVASLDAQRNLSQTQLSLDSSLAKLSSGYRITKAGDDAAGLGVSTSLNAQYASYNQAVRNANDGISLVQTAESGFNAVSNILTRMRELAMQAASDGVSDTQRGYISTEFGQLQDEITRIADTTKYNGQQVLKSGNTFVFQVGIGNSPSDDQISISSQALDATGLGVGNAIDFTDQTAVQGLLADSSTDGSIDKALDTLSNARATFGAKGNRLQTAVDALSTMAEATSATNSRIRDVDVAQETANMTRENILAQAGVSVLAQANQMPQMALKLLG